MENYSKLLQSAVADLLGSGSICCCHEWNGGSLVRCDTTEYVVVYRPFADKTHALILDVYGQDEERDATLKALGKKNLKFRTKSKLFGIIDLKKYAELPDRYSHWRLETGVRTYSRYFSSKKAAEEAGYMSARVVGKDVSKYVEWKSTPETLRF